MCFIIFLENTKIVLSYSEEKNLLLKTQKDQWDMPHNL